MLQIKFSELDKVEDGVPGVLDLNGEELLYVASSFTFNSRVIRLFTFVDHQGQLYCTHAEFEVDGFCGDDFVLSVMPTDSARERGALCYFYGEDGSFLLRHFFDYDKPFVFDDADFVHAYVRLGPSAFDLSDLRLCRPSGR